MTAPLDTAPPLTAAPTTEPEPVGVCDDTTYPCDDPAPTDPPAVPVRGEPVPVEPYPDVCLIDGLRVADYVLTPWPENQGTTEHGLLGCSLPPLPEPVAPATTTATVADPAPTPTLPATGTDEAVGIGAIGVLLIVLGVIARRVAR